jgi:hypothetical protein
MISAPASSDNPNSCHTVVRRDRHGVLLFYHPGLLAPHHGQSKEQPSDRERMEIVHAERALRAVAIIADHLELSEVALIRVFDSLSVIRMALGSYRVFLGMSPLTDKVSE